MNHKRGRPKNRRSGCLLCKPWKMNGAPIAERYRGSDARRIEGADLAIKDAFPTKGMTDFEDEVYEEIRHGDPEDREMEVITWFLGEAS